MTKFFARNLIRWRWAVIVAWAVIGYLAVVDERTRSVLDDIDGHALDRIVDRRWDPPVTLGVRLVSIADDCLQHAGQASYVRGFLPA